MRQLLKDVRVFEVDYGPTQEYKKLRVQEILGCLPSHVTYVSIDFTRERLGDVLVKAGYRSDRITFIIWEGVTMYIPERLSAAHSALSQWNRLQAVPLCLTANINLLLIGLRRTSRLPKRFRKLYVPLSQLKKSMLIGANPGYLDFPMDKNGSFSKASGSTLANYFRRMGPRPDVAILRAAMGALPLP